jgi:hypothetical protein
MIYKDAQVVMTQYSKHDTHHLYRKLNSPRMKQMYATTAYQNDIVDLASMPYARKYLFFGEDALAVSAWIVIAASLHVPFTRPAPGDIATATSDAH